MNQGRIWCVVSPTVGLPVFLGSVAVTALIVHGCVLSHTTWFSGYWEGAKAKVALEGTAPAASNANQAFNITVSPVAATASTQASFVITVAPNAVTTAQNSDGTTSTVAALPSSSASTN